VHLATKNLPSEITPRLLPRCGFSFLHLLCTYVGHISSSYRAVNRPQLRCHLVMRKVHMTETPESPIESTTTATGHGAGTAGSQRPSRLGQAAAAVGIIAGVVFIVGVIFFSGFFLGSRSEEHRGPQVMRCEMGGSGEGKGGMGPGGMGPMGPMGPSQPPSSTSTSPTAPSTPRP
jgi:hypothetical protein